MTKRGGNKTHIEKRSAKALELLDQGTSQKAVAAELGVSRITLWRNLKKLTQNLATQNLEVHEARVAAQEAVLEFIEQALLEEKIEPDVANAWRQVRADIAKLRGLNAESRAIVAHVSTNADPKTLPMYRRFIHETRWVPEEKFEQIWALCRQLEELPGTRPAPGPPEDSPLWHDEEEEKLLTDGGTDETH